MAANTIALMTYADMFDRCVAKAPLATATRLLLEQSFQPKILDELFERVAQEQYTRQILFSDMVGLMASVVQRMNPSVHAAYRNSLRKPSYALSAVYDKINGIEPTVSAAFVADHAERMHDVIDELHATLPPLVPGYATRIVDGNAIAATEHRLKVLRDLRSGALPGKTLVVLDYEYDLVTHIIPCEDGHAQERSLSDALLAHVEPLQLWIADRNFCTTKILRGIHARGGTFLIREHRKIPLYQETPFITISSEKKTILKEQRVYFEVEGEKLSMRRILLKLPRPTRDGDKEIAILTTLPLEAADAQSVMDTYRKRWTIETMFAHLTTALQCEVSGLGHPRAALFAFATALVAANTLSAVRAALRGVHGLEVEERVSMYHLVNDLQNSYSFIRLVEDEVPWETYAQQPVQDFTRRLTDVVKQMDLWRYPKAKKQPRKPNRTVRGRPDDPPHVSTYQLLQEEKRKKLEMKRIITRK